MQTKTIHTCLLAGSCALLAAAPAATAQNLLANAGFEAPAADPEVPNAGAPWINFGAPGTKFTTNEQSIEGAQSLKSFGPFDFVGGGTGALQVVDALPATPYNASIKALQVSGDALEGLNIGVFKIEFLDENMELVAGLGEPAGTPLVGFNVFESAPINADAPVDEWLTLAANGTSPEGTAFVQAVFVQVQLGDGAGNFAGGSIFWDDAAVEQVEPVNNVLDNAGFESPLADPEVPDAGAPWINFGAPATKFTTNEQSFEGAQSLKSFGPFDFIGGGTGALQIVDALPDTTYNASIKALQVAGDELQGDNFGVYKIEFLDENMELVAGLGEPAGTPLLDFNVFESTPFNADSPIDQWTTLDVSGTAPEGAAFLQAVFVQVQLGDGAGNFTGGAIFWDDAIVEPDAPPADCPGDLDGDGEVGSSDLNTLLAAFGQDDGGDLNDDGVTDTEDLNILLANFGLVCD